MAKRSFKSKKTQKPSRPAPKPTRRRPAPAAQKKPSRQLGQSASRSAVQKKLKPAAKGRRPKRQAGRPATGSSRAASPPAGYTFAPPVSPRPEQLPLSDPNWSWEGFQAFSLDLLSRDPKTSKAGKTHHFGKQGDAQEGIDLFADRTNGEHWGLQCKKVKQFSDGDTKKAIRVTTYNADQYIILLTIEATAAVRKVVGRRKKWDVWDVRDISQRVRELPLEDQRHLLDTHFGPAWRKAFMGLPAVSTFSTAETFFGPLVDPSKLFNHAWSLIGRSKQNDRARFLS